MGKNANYSNVIQVLDKMFHYVERDSFVLIYFAGHGHFTENGGYLIPFDYESEKEINESCCISFDSINMRIKRKMPNRFLFLLDTCHSGYAGKQLDLRKTSSGSTLVSESARTKFYSQITEMVNYDESSKNIGRVVFTSCGAQEQSTMIEDKRHGLFTYYLCSGLKGWEKKNEIDVEELIFHVKEQVIRYSLEHNLKQSPMAFTNIHGKFLIPVYVSENAVPFHPTTKEEQNIEKKIWTETAINNSLEVDSSINFYSKKKGIKSLSSYSSIVGLDIGSFAVKLIQLKLVKKNPSERYKLISIGYKKIPTGAIVQQEIIDTTAVANTISQIFSENQIKSQKVCISLSGPSVIIKKILVDRLSPVEMHENILSEAKSHVPFEPKMVNLDYEIFESPDVHPDKVPIVITAVQKELLHNYLLALDISKKTPKIVDVDHFAIRNCLVVNDEIHFDQCIAVINVGASTTLVHIIGKDDTEFCVDIRFGGNQITNYFQKEFNLTFSLAELIKKKIQPEEMSTDKELQVLRNAFRPLILELKKVFEFHSINCSGSKISEILLSGGTTKIEYLEKLLSIEFNTPVRVVNPFKNIEVDSKRFNIKLIHAMAPSFGVAVGLATRSQKE